MNIGKSGGQNSSQCKIANGQYAMKKSSIFVWHRQFNEGQDVYNGQPKTQITKASIYFELMKGLEVSINRKRP